MEKQEEKLSVSTLKEITRNISCLHVEFMIKKSTTIKNFVCNLFNTIQNGINKLTRKIDSTYIALEQSKRFLCENNKGSSILGISTESHKFKIIS